MKKDEKNTDPELFKKIKQSIDSYYEKLEIKKEQKTPIVLIGVLKIKKYLIEYPYQSKY